jgi:DNA excision repair protein ERCC-2
MSDLPPEVATYFPYAEVRPFQDEFIKAVFDAVEQGRSAIVEGSNGMGKTIAALCACLPKAEEKNMKILYVARTHRQHERVIEELQTVSRKRRVSGISIRGRHEMCLNHFVRRNAQDARAVMEICELLKAKNRCPYYRKIEEKRRQYLETQQRIAFQPYNASEIQKICRSKGFCPYELVKDSLEDVRVVALSYLYVFDPVIRTAFLKNLDVSLRKTILIIDEAHNLPETAVDIASSTLTLFALKQAEVEARQFRHRDIADFARTIRNEIENMAVKIQKEALISAESLLELVQEKAGIEEPKRFFEHMYSTGNAIRRDLLVEGKYPRSFIHGMGDFLLKWLETSEDQSFVDVLTRYQSRRGAETARLEIVALDPSEITEPVFSEVHSSIVMSGTLQPLEAYIQITKLPEDTVRKVVPSPFPREHVLPLVCQDVTTAMEERTPQMYRAIIECVREVVESTPANTGIFAASFQVLENLVANGVEEALGKPLFQERRGMSSRENEDLVAEFKAYAKRGGAVLLGAQGGRSSEGVDFPGDQMNSVVIVGVPYAEPTPKVKAQINYFEKRFPGLGREYGYLIPAMKKASQAAGRPIRTLEDRAAMIFLDYRFSTRYCQRFLPLWIRENLRVLPSSNGAISRELDCFFRKAS